MNRKPIRTLCIVGIMVLILGMTLVPSFAIDKGFTIAMVVKGAGNPFFEACKKGGEEAAKQLGNKFIFQGPETPTAEGQISMIDALIAQRVDAILISANDVNALVPVCQKAMKRGIKIITFDSAIAPNGRDLYLNQCDMEQVGRIQVQMLGEMINYQGEIAVLSSASTHTNQNTWIKWMKEELTLPKYKDMNLAAVVYGDDLREKSYNEALGLFKSYPNLKGIISPTTVGVAATARALEDKGLNGQIQLTGLGLPSEMAEYLRNGTCKAMALWNPIDLGYTSTYMAHHLLSKTNKGNVGETMDCGRMGKLKIVDEGNGGKMIILGPPFQFNAKNINDWYKVY